MLTSTLTIVGVMIMMITISPLLALVALVTIPISLFTIKADHQALEDAVHRQWRHTGTLNAQVEEAFTGHALVKVFGRQHDVERALRRARTRSSTRPASAPSSSPGSIQPAMMFLGNLNYVAIAVDRRAAGRRRAR